MYKNKFIPCIREEGRIDLVKGERIHDTISTLRDTLFIILKNCHFWCCGSGRMYSVSSPDTIFQAISDPTLNPSTK